VQQLVLAEANANMHKRLAGTKPKSEQKKGVQTGHRSSSSGNIALGANRYLAHGTKSSTVLAPTLTAVTGEVGLSDDAINETSPTRENKGKGRDPDYHPEGDLFAKKPVEPGSSAAVDTTSSLARSKSQLSFLLEKDRARKDDHKSTNDKKSPKKGKRGP